MCVCLTFDMSWASVCLWRLVQSFKCVSSDSRSCSISWSCLESSFKHTTQTLVLYIAAFILITHTHLYHVSYLHLSHLSLHSLFELMKPTRQHPTLWTDEGSCSRLHVSGQLFWGVERSIQVSLETVCVLQHVLNVERESWPMVK